MTILRFSMRRAVGIGALTLSVAAPLLAQPQGGGSGPRYDRTTEATVSGTVESVEQFAGPGEPSSRSSSSPVPAADAGVVGWVART